MKLGVEPSVKVLRPREYSSTPTYEPTVVESCLNRLKMVIDPLYFDSQRASFSWKAPGNALLCSNNAFIEASFKITSTERIDYRTQSGSTVAVSGTAGARIVASGAAGAVENAPAVRQMDKLAFGSGDAFAQAVSSVQLVINGAVLSNTRQNDYVQALDLAWIHRDVFQKRFARCGGLPTQYDSVCVSGRLSATTGAASALDGVTGDSGIEKRCINLLSATKTVSDPVANQAVRTIRIRAPVRACGIFSPVSWQDEVSEHCPLRQSCIAIPNLNSCQIDYLFSGLEECIVRNLGANAVSVELDKTNDKPTLHVEYLRLDGSRFKPSYIALPAFKINVHEPTKVTEGADATEIAADVTRDNINRILKPLMITQGYGRALTGKSAPFALDSTQTCTWQVSSAQPAPYLAFCLSKSSDQFCNDERVITNVQEYVLGANTDDHTRQEGSTQAYKLARNTNACASIRRFQLEVASSVGSYTYSSESFPFLRTRDELWADVQKYVVRDFCNNDINIWKKFNSIVLLGCQDIIRGLSTCNTSYPLQYTAKVEFGSEREFICGSAGTDDADFYGTAIQRDAIYGRPVMLEIFDKVSLKLSPGSGIVTSQNTSHSVAMSEIHMKKQQQRFDEQQMEERRQ